MASVYLIQYFVYRFLTFKNIEYTVTLSRNEVFEGEQLFLYEEITNNKLLPIPYAKIETELPEGLSFLLMDSELATFGSVSSDNREEFSSKSIQSIFSLGPKQKIRRRWRVITSKRGNYYLGKAMLVTSDIMCLNKFSRGFTMEPSKSNQLIVLPRAIDLSKVFSVSPLLNGDIITNASLVTDPMIFSGIREYTISDPMKLINWKSSAAHSKLMVNTEEHTTSAKFSVILNMNSRENERSPLTPVSPGDVEKCITVCASLFDTAASNDIPMRFISNTMEKFPEDKVLPEGTIEENTIVTPFFKTKNDYISILYLLARLDIRISYSFEKLLALISENPHSFSDNGSFIIATSYISQEIVDFHEKMKKFNISTVFFVTTTNNGVINIPEDMDIRFENISK